MTLSETDHLIWSDQINYEDWRKDMESEYPDKDEQWRIDRAHEINDSYLDDERCNLNIQFAKPIIVIGDLGLWDGRRIGYKDIDSGNIQDCLYSDRDYNTWYVDEQGDLRCEAIHHDGTDYYRYRVFKPTATEEQMEDLRDKIYSRKVTEEDIAAATDRLGDAIGKVYGWTFPIETKPMEVEAR